MLQQFINSLPLLLLSIFSIISIITVVEFKYSLKKSIMIVLAFMLAITILNLVFFDLKKRFNDHMFVLSIFLPQTIIMYFLGRKKGFSYVVATLNVYIAFYLITVTKHILCNKWNYLWLEYLTYLVTFAGVYIYLRFFYKKLHEEIDYCSPKYMPLFGLYALVMFIIINIYRLFIQESPSERILRLDMFAFAIIAAYALSIFFFYFIFKQFKKALIQASDNQILEHQIQRINMANTVREAKEKELKILRHDVRHILSTTSTLIKNKKENEALSFIENYTKVLDSNYEEIYCKDPIINSVIDYYKKKCDSNEIPFNIKINNIEDALTISSHEVAVLIANCLDNAYNATSKLKKNKFIELTFLNNDDRLVLQIKNSFNGKIIYDTNNKPTSTLEGHGIGTSSIDLFASKYNLLLNYEINKNIFSISILFKAD